MGISSWNSACASYGVSMARRTWIEFPEAECMIARPDPCRNILAGSLFQRFFWQKIGEVSRPVHIEWGTIRPNPVFLRARPVSLPKTIALFGIADIHASNQGTLFDFKRLDNNRASNNRLNYYIII